MDTEEADPTKVDYWTDFEVDTEAEEKEEQYLRIHNDETVNRLLVTQDHVGNTAFSAILSRVQYGVYNGKQACLVVLDFAFRFKSKAHNRYTAATIKVEFTKAVDPKQPKNKSKAPKEDPKVENLGPKEVYGIIKTVDEKKVWDVSIPVMFQHPVGITAGVTAHFGAERTEHQDTRMEIHGNLHQDDQHAQGAHAVTWDLLENQNQRDGIFRHFRAAIVLAYPSGQPCWMLITVKPSVAFSINPSRLKSKKDDPVLLDGVTQKEGQADLGCDDFSSTDFPWQKVLWFPEEYKNELNLHNLQEAIPAQPAQPPPQAPQAPPPTPAPAAQPVQPGAQPAATP